MSPINVASFMRLTNILSQSGFIFTSPRIAADH